MVTRGEISRGYMISRRGRIARSKRGGRPWRRKCRSRSRVRFLLARKPGRERPSWPGARRNDGGGPCWSIFGIQRLNDTVPKPFKTHVLIGCSSREQTAWVALGLSRESLQHSESGRSLACTPARPLGTTGSYGAVENVKVHRPVNVNGLWSDADPACTLTSHDVPGALPRSPRRRPDRRAW
jgi:hypothetical protein